MNLQTKITFHKKPLNQIDYKSKILLLGSCFSENIGKKFEYFKFQSVQNPFGILFHPIAIEKCIENSLNEKIYIEKDVFQQNERWHSFDSHSSLSSINKDELLKNLNTSISKTNKELKTATHIIITLATSWVYRFIEKDIIVANCHKIPQKKFLKELLSVDDISESLLATIELIRSNNAKASILFTISPVRHLKDGFVENMQSKAHLISGVHKAVNPRKNIHYFPSYEIVMDELRDYRFYKADMIHPNEVAINYIWEKFKDYWLSEDTIPTQKMIDSIQKGILHKAFNEDSKEHQQFLEKLSEKKEMVTIQYPHIKF